MPDHLPVLYDADGKALRFIKRSQPSARGVSFDAFQGNETNGFGYSDPMRNTHLVMEPRMSYLELSNYYDQDDVAKRIVDLPAKTALKKGVEFDCDDPKLIDFLQEEYERLGVKEKLISMIRASRTFGGAALYLDVDDGEVDPSMPLIEAQVREIKSIYCAPASECLPATASYYPMGHEKAGTPMLFWLIMPGEHGMQQVLVHESRLIRFIHDPPIEQRQRLSYHWWGPSVIQKCHEAIRAYHVSASAGPGLLQSFVDEVIEIDHADLLTQKGQDNLSKFLAFDRQSRSNYNVSLVGKGMTRTKVATPTAGMKEIHESIVIPNFEMASEIPWSIICSSTGNSLTGHSADPDRETYFDTVRQIQEPGLTNVLTPINQLLLICAGKKEAKVKPVWPPLWQPTDREKAETRSIDGKTLGDLVGQGIIGAEEARQTLDRDETGFFVLDQAAYAKAQQEQKDAELAQAEQYMDQQEQPNET